MKCFFSKLILFFVFPIFLVACGDCNCTPIPTLAPAAVAPMETITALHAVCTYAKETEVILGETATEASHTLTPTITLTPTPTQTPTITLTPTPAPRVLPETEAIKDLLNKSIEDGLSKAFHIGRTVTNVKFEPDSGDKRYENLVIELNCEADDSSYCMSIQAFVDLINACKENKDQFRKLIPEYTKTMQLRVIQPSVENMRGYFLTLIGRIFKITPTMICHLKSLSNKYVDLFLPRLLSLKEKHISQKMIKYESYTILG